MILFRRDEQGKVTDLQLGDTVPDGWQSLPGDRLPDIETLHSVEYRISTARSEAINSVKAAGKTRVYRDFDDQDQRRLALKASSNTDRTTCRDLIEAVKATVDAGEAAISTAPDVPAIKSARDAAIAAVEGH